MSAQKLPRVHVHLDWGAGTQLVSLGTCMWLPQQRICAFEWDAQVLASGLNLSPIKMKPESGPVYAPHTPFFGVHSLFADSIPDGFGLRLMNRGLRDLGIERPTPIDRLCWVGERGVGALSYRPVIDSLQPQLTNIQEAARMAHAADEDNFESIPTAVIRAGGSAQGARPKFWAQLSRDGKRVILGEGAKAAHGFDPVLLKFAPSRGNPDEPRYEAACLQLAAEHGVPAVRGRLFEHSDGACLAVDRFDRVAQDGASTHARVHTLSVAALLNLDFRTPIFDYNDLLRLARSLAGPAQVERAFRQMCMNISLHLRDDHTKNFAFCMTQDGQWSFSPAFDLSPCEGVGYSLEHTTTVNSKGDKYTRADLLALASAHNIEAGIAEDAIDKARAAAARFPALATELGAKKKGVQAWKKLMTSVDRLLAPVGASATLASSRPRATKNKLSS